MSDAEIYNSDEYRARIERARRSLDSFRTESEAIETAAESMAYWQMRAVQAERLLYLDHGREEFRYPSNREL